MKTRTPIATLSDPLSRRATPGAATPRVATTGIATPRVATPLFAAPPSDGPAAAGRFFTRRRALALGAAVLGVGIAAPLVPAAALTDQEARLVQRINQYLNGAESYAGSFVQVGPDGSISKGKFFIRRPGRLRFEYDPPSPLLVVSDGTWVIVQDQKLNTTDRYPVSSTPLSVILGERIDLNKGAVVRSVSSAPGEIRVSASSADEEFQGDITLIFADDPLELRQWVTTDARGEQTSVALREVLTNLKLNPQLFIVQDNRFNQGR